MKATFAIVFAASVVLAAASAPAPFFAAKRVRSNPFFQCTQMNCSSEGGWCGALSDTATTKCWSPDTCITDGQKSGTCQPHRAKGEPCTVSEDCRESAVVADGLYCKSGVCTPHAAEGAVCTGWEDCDDGLFCEGGVCVNENTGQLGDSCSGVAQCAYSLQCVDDTCTPFAKRGEACSDDVQCEVNSQCVSGTCVDWFSSKEGEKCMIAVSCVEGLVCGQKGVCVKPEASAGTPCSSDDECPDSNFCKCDWSKGTSSCTAKKPWTASLQQIFVDLQKCFITNNYDPFKCKKEDGAFILALPEMELLLDNICLTQ